MLVVVKPWVGLGFNMPAPGTLIDPSEPVRSQLLGMGVCQRYETAIDPLPDNIEKKKDNRSHSVGAVCDPVRRAATRLGLRRVNRRQ